MRREKRVVVMLVVSGAAVMACGDDTAEPSKPADASMVSTGGASGPGGTSGDGGGQMAGGTGAGPATGGMQGGGGAGGDPVSGGAGGVIMTGGSGGDGGGGGQMGAGGNGGCNADTTSDPDNCGECGNACSKGECIDGECAAYWGDCFMRDEFDTCDAYCESAGAECTPTCGGAGDRVWQGWLSSRASCDAHEGAGQFGGGTTFGCTDELPPFPGGSANMFNCCCVD